MKCQSAGLSGCLGEINLNKIGNWQSAIENVPARAARFVCVIALADPEKVIATFRGEVYGSIGYEPKGSGGFGYDPIFIPDGYDKTFAELGADIKDKISHRANALRKLDEYLIRRSSEVREC